MIEKPIVDAALGAQSAGALGGGAQHGAVEQRLAAEEGEVDPLAGADVGEEQVDRGQCGLQRHVRRRAAEAAAVGVAVAAAEVALLRDGQGQRAYRRIGERCVVDVRPARRRPSSRKHVAATASSPSCCSRSCSSAQVASSTS